MDGSGRVTKRNRQFLQPIVPFFSHQPPTLPNKTFSNKIIRHTDDTSIHVADSISNDYTLSGPSADKAGRPSTLPLSNSQGAGDKSTSVQLPETNTMSQTAHMSDRQPVTVQKSILKSCLPNTQPAVVKLRSIRSVDTDNNSNSSEYMRNPDYDDDSVEIKQKRVRIKTKRFIQEI